jgi:hypothetical protein
MILARYNFGYTKIGIQPSRLYKTMSRGAANQVIVADFVFSLLYCR